MSRKRGPDASALFAQCRTLLDRDDWATSFWWGRAAAVLGRQAVESSLQEFWTRHSPEMTASTARGQFLAVRLFLDERVAADGHATWSLLSRACHHHPYDLQPSRDEVVGWIDAAERFHAALQAGGDEFDLR